MPWLHLRTQLTNEVPLAVGAFRDEHEPFEDATIAVSTGDVFTGICWPEDFCRRRFV